MRIVELGDCSMIIMKDSEDSIKFSIGNFYRNVPNNKEIYVENDTFTACQKSCDSVYTSGRLLLFFENSVDPGFKLHDRVKIY